jgi:Alcohol dehydrogenase GroES-like domain
MSNGLSNAATFPPKRQMTEETIPMKAIVVTDQAAGTAGMKLAERPEPPAAINDVIVQIHASGFVPTEMAWPSTWTDRRDRDRTPSILGHELAGVVTALGYGTTGLSVGQRVFGLADWHRDGTLAEYVALMDRVRPHVCIGYARAFSIGIRRQTTGDWGIASSRVRPKCVHEPVEGGGQCELLIDRGGCA